jgi:hypothetical protein
MNILQLTCDLVNIELAYYYMQIIHLKGETLKRFWALTLFQRSQLILV